MEMLSRMDMFFMRIFQSLCFRSFFKRKCLNNKQFESSIKSQTFLDLYIMKNASIIFASQRSA